MNFSMSGWTCNWAQQGWQCPLCKVVHAPFISRCNCSPQSSGGSYPSWPYGPITCTGTTNSKTPINVTGGEGC